MKTLLLHADGIEKAAALLRDKYPALKEYTFVPEGD